MLKVYSTSDGHASVRYTVTGLLNTPGEHIGLLTDIAKAKFWPKALRLDRVFFSFEKGLSASLHWDDDEQTLIFPIAERGYFDFEGPFSGWSNPRNAGWTGNILLKVNGADSTRVWPFAIKLELTKQT